MGCVSFIQQIDSSRYLRKNLMLPGYQLKNEDLYNISISNAKKFVPDFSDKENT